MNAMRNLTHSRIAWLTLAMVAAGIASNLSAFEDGQPVANRPTKSRRKLCCAKGHALNRVDPNAVSLAIVW